MSCLKMSPDIFFDLTPRAFQLAMKAHNKQEEAKSKLKLEAARLSGFLAARPMMGEESQRKFNIPQKYWPFEWDEKQVLKSNAPSDKMLERARQKLKNNPS